MDRDLILHWQLEDGSVCQDDRKGQRRPQKRSCRPGQGTPIGGPEGNSPLNLVMSDEM